MKGFKDTTKTIKGHCFAEGGVVPGMGRVPKSNTPMVRPVMPRPHVMPGGKPFGMGKMAKLASGGKFKGSFGSHDGAGGPYNNPDTGNSLSMANRPYSKVEQDHPRNNARPGFSKGGKTKVARMRKVARQEVAKHVATKPPQGHGVKPKGGLGAFNRTPLCGGGRY